YAANQPGDSLVIIDTIGPNGRPVIVGEVPVGLDPVTAAVQPNAGDQFVWVANFISDDVSVVDVIAQQVVAVIDVGDEPVNILFSPDGDFAYVVLQGPARGAPPSDINGYLVTIDTSSRSVVHEMPLPGHTPRAAAFDLDSRRIVIASQFSGNNTTLVGDRVELNFVDPNTPREFRYSLELLRDFSITAGTFAASSLAPYPDPSVQPNAPLVPRIVPDAGVSSDWTDIIALLTLPDGSLDPGVVAQFAAEFGGLSNAADVLTEIVDDAKDTLDNDLLVVSVASPAAPMLVKTISGVGTTLTGLATSPVDDRWLVSNREPRNLVRTEPALNGHIVDHQVVVVTNLNSPVITPRDLHAGLPGFYNGQADLAVVSLANPTDVVYNADGSKAYIAAMGPGRVGVLDGVTGRVTARVNVGPGPRSLAIDNLSDRLYVFNRTNLSISVVDIAPAQPVVVDTLYLFNPEPPVIKNGRQFLFSSKFSQNAATSCSTCHVDGSLDNLAWDLGDPAGSMLPAPKNLDNDPNTTPLLNHPTKGPMVTLSLRGLRDHNAFHWRGDKPRFQDFNIAFQNLMGGQQLSAQQMDAYAAYVDTLEYPPSPYYNRDNSLAAPGALNGAVVYLNNCEACHNLSHDGALRLAGFDDDAGMNLNSLFAQIQLVTQLRGIYKKFDADLYGGFGLIHDGREERETNDHPLDTFLENFFNFLTQQERDDLIAFVTAFPSNSLPVVGWEVRVDEFFGAPEQAIIDQMIAQSRLSPSQNDVIAQGVIAGQQVGFHLQPGVNTPVFRSDVDTLLTLTDILNMIGPGDSLVFMAVPPGSGERLALDWDSDCMLNGLDMFPRGTADLDGSGEVDLTDLAVLLAHFGETPAPRENGDIDGDNEVSLADLALLLAHFGD
ncbi:MAG: hypothetical protein D6744_10715, partial [Planctomycetota bacterium]